ncbi:MAG: sigma-54-dependent Fis family transcriptional regulator [Candidatus Cloacimonetes bacterium]|nr:sigma-54-dependent Fis family transcriptional regulator [Candidatus Cloacimonadota bacterium]
MRNEKILIIDDDPQIRMLLNDRLEMNKYIVTQAENGIQGLDLIQRENPDLVLLDLMMPEMDGMEVLNRINCEHPDLTVIILTAFGTIEKAIEAMKLGAYDFLPKPCKPDHILLVVKKALERKGFKEEIQFLKDEIESQYDMFIGESKEMKRVMEMAHRVAAGKTTVLVGGESGTGKQLLSRAIHDMSDRSDKPFVQVNCTTLSEHLLESDLFGHERGAFTGAHQMKKGRVEMAHRGTLFLDEIGDLTPSIQAKLLHFLEQNEFERVGGMSPMKVDVRVIAATNKNLKDEVKEGKFREDLYFRLNVVNLTLPPLRKRAEDIKLLAQYFLANFNRILQKKVKKINSEALNIMKKYHWPGNIRELENVIERAIVLTPEDVITPDLLPMQMTSESEKTLKVGLHMDEAILKFKHQFITRTLKFTNYNQTEAAILLDIQRTYLNRLIKELNIKIK